MLVQTSIEHKSMENYKVVTASLTTQTQCKIKIDEKVNIHRVITLV